MFSNITFHKGSIFGCSFSFLLDFVCALSIQNSEISMLLKELQNYNRPPIFVSVFETSALRKVRFLCLLSPQ